MASVIKAIDAINEIVGKVLMYLILVVVVLIFGEVVARYVFNSPTLWGMTTATWIWGGMSILSGGYVLKVKGHVNMDLFQKNLSERNRMLLDIFNSIILFFFATVIIWAGWKYGWRSVSINEHYGQVWNPPVYPIKMTIFVGTCLLAIQMVAEVLKKCLELATIMRSGPDPDTTENMQ